jgi:hypothetical protein
MKITKLYAQIAISTLLPLLYSGLSSSLYMFWLMILLACTVILYNAEATVRVRTAPALREVIATRMAWMYGWPTRRVERTHRDQGDTALGRNSRAIRTGRDQICETSPTRKRWLTRSESQVQKRSWRIKRT